MNDQRERTIKLIAGALEARDQNRASGMNSWGRVRVQVTPGTPEQYLEDAEDMLDTQIVLMAQEGIMKMIGRGP